MTMPAITITDSERVVWAGSYQEFERQYFNRLSVSEFGILDGAGSLRIGGGALPELLITLSPEGRRDMRLNRVRA
jgi:hypothetical protein